jgi:hypothetical protein
MDTEWAQVESDVASQNAAVRRTTTGLPVRSDWGRHRADARGRQRRPRQRPSVLARAMICKVGQPVRVLDPADVGLHDAYVAVRPAWTAPNSPARLIVDADRHRSPVVRSEPFRFAADTELIPRSRGRWCRGRCARTCSSREAFRRSGFRTGAGSSPLRSPLGCRRTSSGQQLLRPLWRATRWKG